jgi:long-chain acyl-CoA synthetase
MNTDLEQVCLVGTGLHQPIMLATLNEAGRKQDKAQLTARLERDIANINKDVDEHARIAKCLIVDEAWSPMNGLVTPTGKMRRPVVEAHYRELVARAAADRSRVVQWAADLPPTAATSSHASL